MSLDNKTALERGALLGIPVETIKKHLGLTSSNQSTSIGVDPGPLRPRTWDEFIGHRRQKNLVRSTVVAAKKRGVSPESILLWGPPGCGKTALGQLAILELDNNGVHVSATALDPRMFRESVMELDGSPSILYIDDADALDSHMMEALYPLLERSVIKYHGAERSVDVSVWVSTNEPGALTEALRSRFSLEVYVGTYKKENLARILLKVQKSMDGLDLERDHALSAMAAIAEVSRGSPRRAIRLLKRVRDVTTVNEGLSGTAAARVAMQDMGYDRLGLLEDERHYMVALKQIGGQSGLSNIASVLNLSSGAVREIESELLKRGFVKITSRGRELTVAGWSILIE